MVERNLAKVKVAGSRPVFRSKSPLAERIFYIRKFDSCLGGGIGRHEGLKIPWPHGRTGSSPVSGTKKARFLNRTRLLVFIEMCRLMLRCKGAETRCGMIIGYDSKKRNVSGSAKYKYLPSCQFEFQTARFHEIP